MEKQLEFGLLLLKTDVKVKFIINNSHGYEMANGEIYLDKSKLALCPNEQHFMDALQKKIQRSDTFRAKKHTLGLCIMLLVSKGYCITSSQLNEIEDTFVERCWECLGTVADNIPIEISDWVRSSMESKSAPEYSALFCQSRNISSSIDYLGAYLTGKGKVVVLDPVSYGFPNTVWHRDDVASQTMILHTMLGYRDFSGDRQ